MLLLRWWTCDAVQRWVQSLVFMSITKTASIRTSTHICDALVWATCFFCVPLVLNLLFSSHFWTWMSTKGKKICFCSFLKHKRLLWLMISLSSSSDYEALLPFCLSFSTSFITSSGLVNQLWCPQLLNLNLFHNRSHDLFFRLCWCSSFINWI